MFISFAACFSITLFIAAADYFTIAAFTLRCCCHDAVTAIFAAMPLIIITLEA